MGASLDKPITEKDRTKGEGEIDGVKITYAASAMQGWRVDMEDDHASIIGFKGQPNVAFFGVFDGHGGDYVSGHSATNLPIRIQESEAFQKLGPKPDPEVLKTILIESFMKVDEEILNIRGEVSGSTAITCLVTPDHYVVANCGDSRLIIVRDSEVIFATEDHKPYDTEEKNRIEKAGGYVLMQRVNGELAVSRALGDRAFKQCRVPPEEQLVVAVPTVTIIPRTPEDQFIFLACDGIWDVMTNEAAGSFVESQMKQGFPIDYIADLVLDECLERNSRDNMSAMIVTLPGAPQEIGTREAPEPGTEESATGSADTPSATVSE